MKKILLTLLLLSTVVMVSQVSATIPSPQIKCDINNPGDMIEVFNLRDSEAEIITGQTNVVVTYHETSGDALGNGGFIPNPETYENLPPEQIVFVRVENVENANDWQITTMDIIVRQPPIPLTEDPEPLTKEDTEGNGFAIFDLTEIVDQLYSDSFAQEVTYYVTQEDAESQSNPIANPENYMNLTNPQEVYATAQNAPESECIIVTPFQLVVDENLSIQTHNSDLFKVYPNPVENFLSIAGDSIIKDAMIYSASGQLISTITRPENKGMTINVSTLPSGIYFLKINATATYTFIKE